jgi:hypothetical protein
MIDAKVQRVFGGHFGAEPEVYPATIRCESLDRANHFASFPAHIDFVAHAPAARCGRVEEILELLPREWLVGWAARWSDERKRSRHQSILLLPADSAEEAYIFGLPDSTRVC